MRILTQAGGGPIGLTLAMDLAWRGISVVVLERRAPGEPPSVKCNHVSARTMEMSRGSVYGDRGAGHLMADAGAIRSAVRVLKLYRKDHEPD